VGGGAVKDYTWAQTMDQARRMAAHIKSLHLEPGSRVAILSKNCAHFIMAELAIWMAGGTTVAIYPTETADTVRYVLDHSGASLLFVGKLDTWDQQQRGIPPGTALSSPCPLAPADAFESVGGQSPARTQPLTGKPAARLPTTLRMLMYTSGSTGQPKGVMHSFERSNRCERRASMPLRSQQYLNSR